MLNLGQNFIKSDDTFLKTRFVLSYMIAEAKSHLLGNGLVFLVEEEMAERLYENNILVFQPMATNFIIYQTMS